MFKYKIDILKALSEKGFTSTRMRKEKILSDKKLPNPQLEQVLSEIKAIREDFSSIQPYSSEDEHESVVKIRKLLEDNEFSGSYTRKIIDKLKKEFTIEELDDYVENKPTPKNKTDKRKPNEAVVGDSRFKIDKNRGVVIY